ncbi:trigger factor [Candidatus Binatia bacterium]|nr:trigger factor [Candidatus Binatia bacterium]
MMKHKVEVETIDAVRRRLAVEVPAEEVSAELSAAYEALRRDARVRGFRPGRVPAAVLEQMFGDRVRSEVFERLTQRSLIEAIETQQLDALGVREIVTEQAEPGAALRYLATVEVMPEVVVRNYVGLDLERPLVPVEEVDVDAAVERLRQSFANLDPLPDDTAIECGHVVSLAYEARVDGRVVGRSDERVVEIGNSPLPPAFDEHLLGQTAGRDVAFSIAYPAEHGAPEVAGRTADFVVRVRAVFRKEVPVLDDEFAKDHGECGSVTELRERVRRQLEADAERAADEALRRGAMAQLAEREDVPLPEALVRRRTSDLVDEIWREWAQRRIHPQNERAARERLGQELAPRARQEVKLSLLLDAIARQEGIAVSDEAVEAHVAELAARAGREGERVRAIYSEAEARRALRTRLLHAGAIDALVGRAQVRTVERRNSVAEVSQNG